MPLTDEEKRIIASGDLRKNLKLMLSLIKRNMLQEGVIFADEVFRKKEGKK